MKKSLSLILAALLIILSLAGCAGREDSTQKPSDEPTETPTQPSTDNSTNAPDEKPTEPSSEESTEGNTDNSDNPNNPDDSDNKPEGIRYLRSDTGTQLNMILEYDVAKNENGSYTIDVTLKLESYSLNVTARGNTNYIKIDDENFYFSTEAINYSGNEKTTFTLATHRFSVDSTKEKVPVYAIWYFNGTYNNSPLATVVIDGEITLE